MPEKTRAPGRNHGSQGSSALQRDEDAVGFSRPLFLGRGTAPTSLCGLLLASFSVCSTAYSVPNLGARTVETNMRQAVRVLKSRIWSARGSS